MVWFQKPRYTTVKAPKKKVDIPIDLMTKCENCLELIYTKELENNLKVCPKCNYHFRISAKEKISLLVGEKFWEFDGNIVSKDPLKFIDSKPYTERIKSAQSKTNLNEAIIIGEGEINEIKICLGIMEFEFMGGSMGSVVGEKICRLFERGMEKNYPVIIISSSGGARMQEGMFSLMQMVKTSTIISKINERGIPFISVLTNPTSGGVLASFASLGDIIIAEPNAFLPFTGPRVIEQTIKAKLPPGFQRAEFLLEHGMIDMIVARKDLKEKLGSLLKMLK